ncbi:MAG: dihydropteroate synthase [Agriterribacter sp.]
MYTLNCKGRLIPIDQPLVMGILNITPDSFYAKSRRQEEDEILSLAAQMTNEGAAILDIGGQSTRPGSVRINTEEEIARVVPAIEIVIKTFPQSIISIDTYSSKVAEAAIQAGASIVNDISSGDMDNGMLQTVAFHNVPYICMHMLGTPDTMQQHAKYADVTKEVLDYLSAKIQQCKKAGINDIIIDPGFGFGKTIQHNFTLLRFLSVFKILQCPILAGLSRKSTIYKTLGISADEALNGTTVLNTIALMNGANILRVHDVKAAKEAVDLFKAYNQKHN